MMKQFLDLKSKHPDALLLFRTGDFYETYQQDARKASQILGITLTKSSKTQGPDGKPVEMAGFPYHALDTYLPKLIRAGERVAICDQLENPRATAKRNSEESHQENKQEVKEVVAPAKNQEEEQHRGIHR
jgi:DNA mismatch repair ATPase MutS